MKTELDRQKAHHQRQVRAYRDALNSKMLSISALRKEAMNYEGVERGSLIMWANLFGSAAGDMAKSLAHHVFALHPRLRCNTQEESK